LAKYNFLLQQKHARFKTGLGSFLINWNAVTAYEGCTFEGYISA
jgi:hypothetical protein